MKVYKITVSKITAKGKLLPMHEEVVKSEENWSEVKNTIQLMYKGLNVEVSEIPEIREILGNGKKQSSGYVYSYQEFYVDYFKLDTPIEATEEELPELTSIKETYLELEEKKKEFLKKVQRRLKSDLRYSMITELKVKLFLDATKSLKAEGKIPVRALGSLNI